VSVRELVRAMQKELLSTDLQPETARTIMLRATSLMGNCLEELRDADIAFNDVLLKHLDGEKVANRARVRAETTEEYRRAREAKDTLTLVTKMGSNLKTYLSSLDTEIRMAGR
jgi:hypothetical protein